MSCRYCVNGKIELFTSIVDCLECQAPVQKYPELAEGRFFWIDSECKFELPEGTWWRGAYRWFESKAGAFGGRRHLYALPGPKPTHVPDDAPVLDRPPFGAWGDRFYFLGEKKRRHQWYEMKEGEVWLTDGKHTVGPFGPEMVISEHAQGVAEFGEMHYGYTTQELLDWLEAQR